MAAKRVLLLLSSDRLSYPLVRFLSEEGKKFKWKVIIGCMFDPHVRKRMMQQELADELEIVDIATSKACDQAIKKSDLVIGMVTDTLLLEVADSCLQHRKTLISPAALTRQLAARKAQAKEHKVLLLMDCGFSPGLDHITAKKAIDNIHAKGGTITSFRTYSGSFIASGENPLGFRLTETAGELLTLFRQNNRHLMKGRMQHIPYHKLFERGEKVVLQNHEDITAIPAGDSLYYRKIYSLANAHTVVKGKLVPKGFDRMWDIFLRLGLTDSTCKIDLCGAGSFYHFLDSFLPCTEAGTLEERLQSYAGVNGADIAKLKWLGLFDNTWLEHQQDITPAHILQHLLETRLSAQPDDQDYAVMQHHLAYQYRDDQYELTATLVSKGASDQDSALANAIALTCGAAAKSVLLGSVTVKGLHIPVIREIYDPILNELSDSGVAFHVEDKRVSDHESVEKV
ncbi:MAG: saccharopine dehydrogenase C-terminal domain-containing protein [Chryseosolibacter sp.]